MPNVIYRIQDSEGRGPFKPNYSSRWVVKRPDHDNLLPWMAENRKLAEELLSGKLKKNVGCGCTTLDQLRRWFIKEECKILLKEGYRAYLMEVDEILFQSKVQTVFSHSTPFSEATKTEIKLYDL